MELKDKSILITGASSGIGYELAKQLVDEKCNLILVARRKEILDSLEQIIKTDENVILTYHCDIRNKSEVASVFCDIRKKIDHIDIAILNSGVGHKVSVENFDSKLADETFDVNVLGLIYCVEELLKDFMPRKNGIIAGVSSIADVRGFPINGFYCASKAAASTFLESIRIELKKYNVNVITIRPGFVRTPMTAKNKFKMPFLMDAGRAAQKIINGVKKEKKIIEFPVGTILGGKLLKILPNFLFDYLTAKGLPKIKSEL